MSININLKNDEDINFWEIGVSGELDVSTADEFKEYLHKLIDEEIRKKFSPIALTNDSSEYYNKVLFPYINKFECKLRCFLYLKSTVSENPENFKNIQNLESKDFGEIYELLFTDANFTKEWNLSFRRH